LRYRRPQYVYDTSGLSHPPVIGAIAMRNPECFTYRSFECEHSNTNFGSLWPVPGCPRPQSSAKRQRSQALPLGELGARKARAPRLEWVLRGPRIFDRVIDSPVREESQRTISGHGRKQPRDVPRSTQRTAHSLNAASNAVENFATFG